MIRAASREDLDALAELEYLLFPEEPWSAETFRGLLDVSDDGPQDIVLVLDSPRDDGERDIAGYGCIRVVDDFADLLRFGIHPDRQGEGLGAELLRALVEAARETGVDRLLLEVRSDNRAALALYAAAKFGEIDRRRGYYRDGTDALVMERAVSGRMRP